MKLKEAIQSSKKATNKVDKKMPDSSHKLGIELSELKKKIERLNNIQYSLWNSLITFNGILIATFAIIASLTPEIFNSAHLRILLIITTGAILLFVLNFKYAHIELEKNIKKELDILELKIKGLNINALAGPPHNTRRKKNPIYKIFDKCIQFCAKKSIELALVLTLISVIYFWVLTFKFIK